MESKYILAGLGFFYLIVAVLKPPMFWNSRRTMRSRKMFGDGITQIINIAISILLIILAFTLG